MTEPYRIILADDHAILRKGMRLILEQSGEFLIIAEAEDGLELLALLEKGVVPDALLLDLTMPGMSGIEATERIRQLGFVFKILVLTMHLEPDLVCQAFSAGANGYLLKEGIAAELWTALQALSEDKIYISPKIQRELPDTCQMKVFAGIKPLPAVKHCEKFHPEPPLPQLGIHV
jgi:DNA-binding NarL/FixJ family response regulator